MLKGRELSDDAVNPVDVDAVILVGGQGTRLRPLTLSAPKPMLPTAGVPFLSHLLARIAAAGIRHVVLGTSYKAEVFEQEFGDGSKLGLEIEYVVEDEPRGTGGGIANVAPKLRHPTAMVFNGDVLSGLDLGAMLASHLERQADVTLHLVRVSDPRAFGCVPTDSEGVVTAFLEKTQDPPTDQINAGCYLFQRAVIDEIVKINSATAIETTKPGIGHSSNLEVSGGSFTGIIRSIAAVCGSMASAVTDMPFQAMRVPLGSDRNWAETLCLPTVPRQTGSPGRQSEATVSALPPSIERSSSIGIEIMPSRTVADR